jgi:YidC/Oxa1 family membrane protein insertase
VNKNTLLAMVIIFGAFLVFTSQTYQRFYYNKILKQPYPVDIAKQKNNEIPPSAVEKKNTTEKEIESSNEMQLQAQAPEEAVINVPVDTASYTGDTIWVETEKLIVGIHEIGARIVSLQTKEYRIDHAKISAEKTDSTGYVDLIPRNSAGAVGMTINNTEYDGKFFACTDKVSGEKIQVRNGDTTTLTFKTNDFSGKEIKKQYIFSGEGYRIGLKVINENLKNNRLLISWKAGIFESENLKTGTYQTEERKAHYFDGENVQHVKLNKTGKEDVSGFYKWIGVSSKYFFVALVADTLRDADLKIIGIEETKKDSISGKKDKTKAINYSLTYQSTLQENNAEFWLYAGPSKLMDLKGMKLKFEETLFPVIGWPKIFFWADVWFPPVAKFVLWLLIALFGLAKDYGIAIVLLTIISKVVTFPLTQSSMKSMNRLKDIQPKITALRNKYKSNPKKLNEETMALYKSEGVNPLNPGCLPMFLQMPVFIALYVVLGKAIELRGASTLVTPWIKDLSIPESVFSFASLIPGGIPFYGSSFAILPVIMAVLTFFQNKMTIKDPNQKMMIYFMPVFMLVIFNNFPAGLVLYWTLQSALGIVQQWYLDKSQKKKAVVTESIYTPHRSKKK